MDEHLETQLEMAREQLAYRREIGDRLEVVRPIDQLAYFTRKSPAVQAAAVLEDAGYRTALTRRKLLGATLEATRVFALDEQTVEAFVTEVHQIVVSYGGDYDGWSGGVIESSDAGSADD